MSEESDGEVLAAQENAGESDLPNSEEEEVVVQQLPDYFFSRMKKMNLGLHFGGLLKNRR